MKGSYGGFILALDKLPIIPCAIPVQIPAKKVISGVIDTG